MKDPKVLGIIPARGGSKGIKNKNIKSLCGMPLIAYSILSSFRSKHITRLIVSTDSSEIKDISESYGAEVPFMRPKKLSQDNSLSIDLVIHAIQNLKENYDYVVLLQPTTPFRKASYIDYAISTLMKNNCDTVVSMVNVGANHPSRMYTYDDDKLLPIMTEKQLMGPRQHLGNVYIRSGDIYAARTDFVLNEKKLMGGKCTPIFIDQEEAVNIDTLNDFILAEILMEKYERK